MAEQKKSDSTQSIDRRNLVRKGLKVAYTVPLVLAAVKATERPAYGATSGVPVPVSM